MKKGYVSVLLTSYNRPNMLRDAISSVLKQTYPFYELFILDDNSNEETVKVIKEYSDLEKVVYYNSEIDEKKRFSHGSRYAENINWGIENSDGEFITYLTDDDYYLPKRLELMVDYLNNNDCADVVYGRQRKVAIDKEGNVKELDVRMPDIIHKQASCSIDHNSVLHRRSCIKKVGLWPTTNLRCADAEFWYKLNKAGFNFYPIKEITDVKRYHENTITAKLDRKEYFGNEIYENTYNK